MCVDKRKKVKLMRIFRAQMCRRVGIKCDIFETIFSITSWYQKHVLPQNEIYKFGIKIIRTKY